MNWLSSKNIALNHFAHTLVSVMQDVFVEEPGKRDFHLACWTTDFFVLM